MNLFTKQAYGILLLILTTFFISCEKNSGMEMDVQEVPDLLFYALTDDNRLLALNASEPGRATNDVRITGLLSGEKALSIDYRPATGQLYLLTSISILYTLDPETGKATNINPERFQPLISGAHASIDFNPTVDRLRLVSNTGQNLRLNPENGAVAATDGMINGVSDAAIAAVAYTNSFAGASETILYDIDATTDKLYKQLPPNDGVLQEVGSLGVDVKEIGGFDIDAEDNRAIAALSVGDDHNLYGIDLSSGTASFYGILPANEKIIGLAIPTSPVVYAVGMNNNLIIFNPMHPEEVISKPITGIQEMENIMGIDMRPINGQLFGLGSSGRLYSFNLSSGVAMMVGTSPLMITGENFGFDFNPTVDRIRIVSNTGMNLRVNPDNGMLSATDGDLNPGTPFITAAAYANNNARATTTTLFVIDSKKDELFKQDPPNAGTLVSIGKLGIDITANNGFDIGGKSGNAFAILTTGSGTAIYRIDLVTGTATKINDFPMEVRAMSIGLGF